MGAGAFRLPNLELIPGCILEIGSERGEGSTGYLANLALERKERFITVDPDPEVYQRVSKVVHAYQMTGEQFMKGVFPDFGENVAFAYLDNFDWIWKGFEEESFIIKQVKDYKKRGVELNNTNSQKAHLRQSELINDFTFEGALILFDDTWPTGDGYDGKGGTAVPYLLENGWTDFLHSTPQKEDMQGFVLMRKR